METPVLFVEQVRTTESLCSVTAVLLAGTEGWATGSGEKHRKCWNESGPGPWGYAPSSTISATLKAQASSVKVPQRMALLSAEGGVSLFR